MIFLSFGRHSITSQRSTGMCLENLYDLLIQIEVITQLTLVLQITSNCGVNSKLFQKNQQGAISLFLSFFLSFCLWKYVNPAIRFF